MPDKTYIVNGSPVDVADSDINTFKQKYPEAKEVYSEDEEEFDILSADDFDVVSKEEPVKKKNPVGTGTVLRPTAEGIPMQSAEDLTPAEKVSQLPSVSASPSGEPKGISKKLIPTTYKYPFTTKDPNAFGEVEIDGKHKTVDKITFDKYEVPETKEQKLTWDIGGEKPTEIKTPPELSQLRDDIGTAVPIKHKNYIEGTAQEINNAFAETLETMDAAAQFIEDATGLKKGDTFTLLAKNLRSTKGETPEGIAGEVLKGTAHVIPLIMETTIAPEIKLMQLSKWTNGAIKTFPKLSTVLGVNNFFNTYAQTQDESETNRLVQSLSSAGVGVADGFVLHSLGYGASKIGGVVAEATKSPLLGATSSAVLNGIGFAGYGATGQLFTEEYAKTGKLNWEQIAAEFGTGFVLGIPQIAQAAGTRAINNYSGASPELVKKSREIPKTITELRDEAVRLGEQISTAKSDAEKNQLFVAQQSLNNLADVKAIGEMVEKNPEGVKSIVDADETLTPEEKQFFKDKIDKDFADATIPAEANDIYKKILAEKKNITALEGNKFIAPEIKEVQKKISEERVTQLNKELTDIIQKSEEQKTERDEVLRKIQQVRKDLGVEFDMMEDLPESVVMTFNRIDGNKPTSIIAIDEAENWLYGKYKQVKAEKNNPKRMLTTDQIDGLMEQIGRDIGTLENYKPKQYEEATRELPETPKEIISEKPVTVIADTEKQAIREEIKPPQPEAGTTEGETKPKSDGKEKEEKRDEGVLTPIAPKPEGEIKEGITKPVTDESQRQEKGEGQDVPLTLKSEFEKAEGVTEVAPEGEAMKGGEKFITHNREEVSGKRLSDAINKVADDMVISANKKRQEPYASHITEKQKDETLAKDLDYAEQVRKGENLDNFTIWQRINYELTGESVPLFSDKKGEPISPTGEKEVIKPEPKPVTGDAETDKRIKGLFGEPTKAEKIDKARRKTGEAIDRIVSKFKGKLDIISPEERTTLIHDLRQAAEGIAEELGIRMEDAIVKLKEKLDKSFHKFIDENKDEIIGKKKEEPKIPKMHKTESEAETITKEKSKKREKLFKENPQIELKDDTWFDKLATEFQNRFRRLGKVQKAAEKAGIGIVEKIDAEMANELLTGKAKARIDNMENEIIEAKKNQEPALFQRMAKDKVDVAELGLYMYAKHAQERNAKVAKERREEYNKEKEKIAERREALKDIENENIRKMHEAKIDKREKELEEIPMDDGGSGMTNQQAKDVISEFEKSGKSEKLDKYAKELREKVIDKNLDNLLEDKLISQKQYDELKTQFENYVPLLVGEKMEGKVIGKGRSADLRGKDIFRAKGSNLYGVDKRVNPVASALFNFQKSVIRGEKNKSNITFLNLAKEIGEPYFEVVKPEYNVKTNSIGEIEYVYRNYDPKLSDNSVELKMDGKPILVVVKDPSLLRAMKGLGVTKAIPFLSHLNTWLRGVNTIYNPEFIVSNFIRDIQTAVGNLSAEQIKGIEKNTLLNIPKAMKGVWENEMGTKSEWSDIVQEMKDEGGDISWLQVGDINEYSADIKKQIDKYNSNKLPSQFGKVLSSTLNYYRAAGAVSEKSVRVSAYKAAIDGGVSKSKAAQLAKNLTVNFEKKGNLGATLNSLYLFAGAGIQGNAKMIASLAKSKNTQKLFAATVAGSVIMNVLNSYINDDEYEKIDDGIKERNLIVMHFDGTYNKIPLPYGYNVFKVFGDAIYEIGANKKTIAQGLGKITLATANAFNPISSSTFNQMISPTITDPFVQVSENKNWRAAPILPETGKYEPEKKASSKYFSTVRPISKSATDFLNEVSGGTAMESGYVDISPELVDHFYDFFTGGSGRMIANTINGTAEVVAGDLPEAENTPFIRTFYGKPSDYRDTKIVYEMEKDSYIKLYDENEKKKFFKSLDNALKENAIDKDNYDLLKESFEKGQKLIKLSIKNPQMSIEELKDEKIIEELKVKLKEEGLSLSEIADRVESKRNRLKKKHEKK